MKASVVAVVATYHRAKEIAALLASLIHVGPALAGVVITDNANDDATAAALAASPLPSLRLTPGRNLGCGGGLALAEGKALEHFASTITHVWILDDDAVVEPASLDKLLEAMAADGAGSACSAVTTSEGRIGWFPGLLERAPFDAVRAGITPAEFVARFGVRGVPFSWGTGVSLIVRRDVLEQVGPHRSDYHIRGEDLEFTLRITSHARGIFVPESVVAHLPPPADNVDPRKNHLRSFYLLQNLAYTGFRVPHGRSLVRTFPGNWWRFFRLWGFTLRNVRLAVRALWRGAILGHPVGADPVALAMEAESRG